MNSQKIEIEEASSFNIHQRRFIEKNKIHVCHSCSCEIIGWICDNIPNCILECYCRNCKRWNNYKYWP